MTGCADSSDIRDMVLRAVAEVKVTDIHTHLYPPEFGPLMLWGIDEVLTYHYLIAETMRRVDIHYDTFWAMSKQEQADLIWRTLFIEHSPISEACRGVLTALNGLGLDVSSRDLSSYRDFFAKQNPKEHVNHVLDLAGVESVVMTNDPFDEAEKPVWLAGGKKHPRFHAALRIDTMLNSWDTAYMKLKGLGHHVQHSFGPRAASEVRRFLKEWIERMNPLYMAASFPTDFAYPEDSARGHLIDQCVIPVSKEMNVPFALMIGVKRAVNPELRSAGDSVGRASVESVERLCARYPENKFLVTMLSRENQHELCVAARKFRNLLIFGCWWFLNNPSLIEEITRMRFELLGLSVIPQHSDVRVLEQLIYKWAHSRQVIGDVLAEKYVDLAATGWVVFEDEIRRDVADLFGGNFWSFLGKEPPR